MADTSSELIGGRYRVLANLGKGAMGLVFMAHDPVLDRKVAIKQMTAEIADNEELRQRFYVEARAAARLNHPNIITIHELQESGGEIFIIMELLEGKSLADLIQSKPVPLSLEATLDVMAQVCEGLDYAHQRAIVHRDIKPANLFLTPSGTLKILDFGIARLGSLHMTAAGALIGTPDYMAPEQIRGDEIDRRTDLWAVGAVLYQLLSGTKPFEGKPLARLLTAISQTPHVPLQQRAPTVPKSVSDLVDRLLAKPRDARPSSAGIVRDELRAILGADSSASTKARLAEDEYEETIFMVAPPQAKTGAPASAPPPVAVPPLPARMVLTTAPSADVRSSTSIPTLPAVSKPAEITPPSGSMASTAAGEALPEINRTAPLPSPAARPETTTRAPVAVDAAARPAPAPPPVPAAPAANAVVPPVPASPAIAATSKPVPSPAAAPPVAAPPVAAAPSKHSSRLLIAIVIVLVVGLSGLVVVGGAAWWYFGRPGASLSSWFQGATATSTTAGPAPESATPTAAPDVATSTPPAGATPPGTGQPLREPAAPATVVAPPATESSPGAALTPAAAASREPVTGAPSRRPSVSGAAVQPAAPFGTGAKVRREPSIETGVAPAAGATQRPGLAQDTVDTLAGRQSGQAYDGNQAVSTLAAIKRINYVLEQYVQALVNADADAVREYRTALSPEESLLMRTRQLKVRLEDVRVEVNGTEATARCRRKIEGTSPTGSPIREDTATVFRLTRRPSGWVITDIR